MAKAISITSETLDKDMIVFPTPTGYKVFDQKLGKVIEHKGTKEEIALHLKKGWTEKESKEEKETETRAEFEKRIIAEAEKKANEAIQKAIKENSESSNANEEKKLVFISKKNFEALPKEEQEKYKHIKNKGYTLKEGK